MGALLYSARLANSSAQPTGNNKDVNCSCLHHSWQPWANKNQSQALALLSQICRKALLCWIWANLKYSPPAQTFHLSAKKIFLYCRKIFLQYPLIFFESCIEMKNSNLFSKSKNFICWFRKAKFHPSEITEYTSDTHLQFPRLAFKLICLGNTV